jgi:hypothetical protein
VAEFEIARNRDMPGGDFTNLDQRVVADLTQAAMDFRLVCASVLRRVSPEVSGTIADLAALLGEAYGSEETF